MALFIRFPSWHLLKVIGGSYFSSWTMAVPFLGYLILLGSISGTTYTLDVANIDYGNVIDVNNVSFMRLKVTYLGLSLVGFATIIFRLICPANVSKHKDRDDYIQSAAVSTFPDELDRGLTEIQQPVWYDRYIDGKEACRDVKLYHTSDIVAARMHNGGNQPFLDRDDWLRKNVNSINAIHYLKYELLNYSMIIIRYIIFLMFTAGFCLTLIPSLAIFKDVALNVITSL
jgi:hypothetical protein